MNNFSPTTRNLLSLLETNKIIRLKKNSSRNSKYLDRVFDEFKQIAKSNQSIRCLESSDPVEMIVLYDINYKIDSFIV